MLGSCSRNSKTFFRVEISFHRCVYLFRQALLLKIVKHLSGPDKAQPEDPFFTFRSITGEILSLDHILLGRLLFCSSMKRVVDSTISSSFSNLDLASLAEQICSLSHRPMMTASAQPNPKQTTGSIRSTRPAFTSTSNPRFPTHFALLVAPSFDPHTRCHRSISSLPVAAKICICLAYPESSSDDYRRSSGPPSHPFFHCHDFQANQRAFIIRSSVRPSRESPP